LYDQSEEECEGKAMGYVMGWVKGFTCIVFLMHDDCTFALPPFTH
jgi:hypothetical protein